MKTEIADLEKAERFSLPAPPWGKAPAVRAVHEALDGQALVVGGAVRDALLGVSGGDYDVATPFPPDEVMVRMAAAGLKAYPTGIDHGTVTVVAHDKPVEVTTFRRDVATDGRRAVVAFTASALEDARRRDFTINALYATLNGEVYDFFSGRGDLEARRVRFIGDPSQRIAEDYLRILRFFRFSARFSALPLDEAGLAAAVAAREKLSTLSRERIRAEFLRMLEGPDPAPVLETMFGHGFLEEIVSAAPRLMRLRLLRQREIALGEPHSAVRGLAALYLHSADHVEKLKAAFVLSRAEQRTLAELADAHAYPASSIHEAIFCFGGEVVANQALCAPWLEVEVVRAALETARTWHPPVFPVSGGDLLAAGVAPGPAMGEKLKRLETAWVASGFNLSKAELLRKL